MLAQLEQGLAFYDEDALPALVMRLTTQNSLYEIDAKKGLPYRSSGPIREGYTTQLLWPTDHLLMCWNSDGPF